MTDTLKTYPARLAATQARPFPVWGLWLGLTLASAGCDGVNTRLGTQSLLADGGVVAGPTFEFAQCGNGEVERGEECEPPGTSACSEGCQNLAPRCGDGTLGDREECDDGNTVDGDGCSRSCEREECGNGRTEGLEECEPPDGVACDRNCQVLSPSGCGDRVLDLGEKCDDGNADPGDGCSDLCLIEECGNRRIDFGETCEPPGEGICQPDCQRFVPLQATCGDSIQESTEQCDDGNTVGADGCSPQCRLEECGNLVLDEGESCEPPGAFGCSADCQRELTVAAVCGDSVVSGSEQCDDGGRQDGDGCSAACLAEECGNGRLDFGEECEPPGVGLCGDRCVRHRCGNGKVEGNEECDDHNLLLGDGCDSQCRREFCGNGRIDRALGENCELPSSGSCGSDCRTVVPTCGNGLREAGEQCDDGNRLFGDGCNLDCEVEVCGNGELDYPGECEPPGTASCDSSCRRFSRVCGDGLLVGGEECEDGNALPGDGCDSLCRLEGCGNGRVEPAIGEQCEPPGSAVCDARCMKVGVAAGVAVGPVPRSTALLRTANPEFDGSVAGWHSSSRARLTLSSDDHEARVGSGSALLAVGPKFQSVGAMQQCVPMGGGVEYRVQAQIRSPPTASAVAGITVEHFSSPACAESSALGGGFSTSAQSTPNWSLLRLPPASFPPDAVQAPEGARSVLVSVTATRTSEKPALLLVDSVHVSPSSGSRCGNGLVEPPDEECEPNTDRGCSAECLLPSVCGDGVVSGGEQCEPLLAGRACRPDTCSWVVRSFCGNGRVEAGEQCDPPSLTLGCGSDCQPIRCGNGITEPPEQCDAPGDPSCSARCLRVIPSECGNGVVEPGEQCDPPNLTDPAALCTMQCQALPPAECGNGTVERPVEQCDPPSSDCSARCQWLPNVCQDGRVGPGEQCDPPDGLFCSQSCQRPACYSCLAEQCTPPARAADLFAACDQLPGLAPTGPGRGRPRADLCREAVDCIKRTGCAQATDAWAASACYCGSDVLEREDPRFDVSPERLLACRDGVSEPRGACKAAFERAAESTVAEEVLAALARPDSERALGRANALLRDCGLGGPAACRSECAPNAGACGNGVVEANERCDPQDPVTGKGCDPTYCTVLPCGNGVIDRVYPPEGGEPPEGWLQEDCDVADPFSRLRCDLDCQLITTCGDGNVEGKEQCDPGPEGDWSKCCRSGNAQLLAACDRNDDGVVAADEQCRVVASCGDGVRDGAEECDDGALGSDACSPECKFRGPCADCSQLYCQYQIDEWEVRHLEPYKVQALEALACMEETGCFDASRTQCICGELSQLFCGAFGGGIEGTAAAGLRPDQGGACYPLLAAATESACDPPPPGQTVASCTTSRAGNVESGYGAARQLQICRRINCNQECGMAPW